MSGERILVVDDDARDGRHRRRVPRRQGLPQRDRRRWQAPRSPRSSASEFDAVITDLRMDGVDGLDVLDAARAADPTRPVIIMTAYGTIDGAIEAVRRGASHYLTKPFKLEEAVLTVERALAERGLGARTRSCAAPSTSGSAFATSSARAPVMQQLYDLLERVSAISSPVLITGESGTGKELVARALHHGSAARHGAVRGGQLRRHPRDAARVRAVRPRQGRLHRRHRGQAGPVRRGRRRHALPRRDRRAAAAAAGQAPARARDPTRAAGRRRRPSARSTCASSPPPTATSRARSARSAFREDLYYRLNVIPIHLPPLRERREDIPLLVEHFVARFTRAHPERAGARDHRRGAASA